MTILTSLELEKYSRQIRLDGFGIESQHKLKNSTALISRVGGVGGTVAASLARAGIGHLIIVHGGTIVAEYLNRMMLATPDDLGKPCTEAFAKHLRTINPDVRITAVNEYINEQNVALLVSQSDIVIDGAPLFEERYTMNQEAVRQKKPLIMGAMYGNEGYVTTIIPGESPCLACIYPERPDYWTNIQVFPAIGPVPWIVGSMCSMEAIKVLTGFGETLKGQLLLFDIEINRMQYLRIHRRTDCPVCSSLGISG